MDNMSSVVGEFPAFRKVAPLVLSGMPGDSVIPFGGVHGPIVADQSFQPGAVDARQPFGEIGVKIHDVPFDADDHFITVLRLTKPIPPIRGFVFQNTPLTN